MPPSLARSLLLEPPDLGVVGGTRMLQAVIAWPSVIFLLTLGVMLFRPPDLSFYHLDRIAFAGLVFCVFLRVLSTNQSFRVDGMLTSPMLMMLLLALWAVLQRPYDSALWATFAARWLVPFVLYQLSQFVFCNTSSLHQFEGFCLAVLAYLSVISIAFLIGADWLIFPRFILDEGLGIHAERARGPFLQAVANGVTLNLLGLLALNAFRRGRLRGWLAWVLLASLPLAVLATKTRSIWLSFSASILLLPLISKNRRVRRAAMALVVVGGVTVIITLSFSEARTAIADRFAERSPVEFRESMYQAGWEMFLEKPLLGWNTNDIQPELALRITDFKLDTFIFHNTYLDVAVSNGAFGLAIYLWLFIDLLRLGRTLDPGAGPSSFLDKEFRALWPVLVAVYVINASFVLMHYQFVNALLFTLAGMLAAQNRQNQRGDEPAGDIYA